MHDLEWNALEHSHEEKSREWFYALGILAVSSALTAGVLGNIFFALLILIAALTLALLSLREPRLATFVLNNRGLTINDEWYPMDTLRAFWIDEKEEGATLLIDTPHVMTPDLVVPIAGVHPEQIRDLLRKHNVEERELHEPLAIKVLEVFGL